MQGHNFIQHPSPITCNGGLVLSACHFSKNERDIAAEFVRYPPFQNFWFNKLPWSCCIMKTTRFLHDTILQLPSIKHFHHRINLHKCPTSFQHKLYKIIGQPLVKASQNKFLKHSLVGQVIIHGQVLDMSCFLRMNF